MIWQMALKNNGLSQTPVLYCTSVPPLWATVNISAPLRASHCVQVINPTFNSSQKIVREKKKKKKSSGIKTPRFFFLKNVLVSSQDPPNCDLYRLTFLLA